MKYLVTGSYGFIGFSITKHLLEAGHEVVGIDRVNNAVSAKEPRIAQLKGHPRFSHCEVDMGNYRQVEEVFERHRPKVVIHMAAQYAVAPLKKELLDRYIHSNCKGFCNLGWAATQFGTERVIYASSTFVDDHQKDTHTYGATKRFNESMAGVFAHNSPVRFVGIRYGSTFGPECRSDVGVYKMMDRMFNGMPHPLKGGYMYQTAFLHSQDAVDVTLAAAHHRFNTDNRNLVFTAIMDDHRYSLADLAYMAHEMYGIPFLKTQEPLPNHPLTSKPRDAIQSMRLVDFTPKIKMVEALKHFGDWFKENRC